LSGKLQWMVKGYNSTDDTIWLLNCIVDSIARDFDANSFSLGGKRREVTQEPYGIRYVLLHPCDGYTSIKSIEGCQFLCV